MNEQEIKLRQEELAKEMERLTKEAENFKEEPSLLTDLKEIRKEEKKPIEETVKLILEDGGRNELIGKSIDAIKEVANMAIGTMDKRIDQFVGLQEETNEGITDLMKIMGEMRDLLKEQNERSQKMYEEMQAAGNSGGDSEDGEADSADEPPIEGEIPLTEDELDEETPVKPGKMEVIDEEPVVTDEEKAKLDNLTAETERRKAERENRRAEIMKHNPNR